MERKQAARLDQRSASASPTALELLPLILEAQPGRDLHQHSHPAYVGGGRLQHSALGALSQLIHSMLLVPMAQKVWHDIPRDQQRPGLLWVLSTIPAPGETLDEGDPIERIPANVRKGLPRHLKSAFTNWQRADESLPLPFQVLHDEGNYWFHASFSPLAGSVETSDTSTGAAEQPGRDEGVNLQPEEEQSQAAEKPGPGFAPREQQRRGRGRPKALRPPILWDEVLQLEAAISEQQAQAGENFQSFLTALVGRAGASAEENKTIAHVVMNCATRLGLELTHDTHPVDVRWHDGRFEARAKVRRKDTLASSAGFPCLMVRAIPLTDAVNMRSWKMRARIGSPSKGISGPE